MKARILVMTATALVVATGSGAAAGGARPIVTRAPEAIRYGQGFVIGSPDATSIATVVLIPQGPFREPVTDPISPYPLDILGRTTAALTVQAPGDAGVVRPGRYLLFVATDLGLSSLGHPIVLQPPAPGSGGPGASSGGRARATVGAAPASSRSPLGRIPWMLIALVFAFMATAVGLKRLS